MPGTHDILRSYNILYVGQRALRAISSALYVPGDYTPAVVSKNDELILTSMHWGFGQVYNTRGETIESKDFWRDSYHNRRMIFPINSFFEGRWFVSSQPMAAAGIYRRVRGRGGSSILESSMITTSSGDIQAVASYHLRRPVMVPLDEVDLWLNHSIDLPDLGEMQDIFYRSETNDEEKVNS